MDATVAESASPEGEYLVLNPDNSEMQQWVKRASKEEISGNVFIISEDATQIFEIISSQFTLITAAGGLVHDGNQNYLMIFRNGHWDLPKGKVETDELLRAAATREVEEECGIAGLTIISELAPTYHEYKTADTHFLKHTHWYLMQAASQPTTPQAEEGIARAVWMTPAEIEKIIEDAYPSVADVLVSAGVVEG